MQQGSRVCEIQSQTLNFLLTSFQFLGLAMAKKSQLLNSCKKRPACEGSHIFIRPEQEWVYNCGFLQLSLLRHSYFWHAIANLWAIAKLNREKSVVSQIPPLQRFSSHHKTPSPEGFVISIT